MSMLNEVEREIELDCASDIVSNMVYKSTVRIAKWTTVLSIVLAILIYGEVGGFATASFWWVAALFFYPIAHWILILAGSIIYYIKKLSK